MGAHSQVFVRRRTNPSKVKQTLLAQGLPFQEGTSDWVVIDDREADLHEGDAQRLSKETGVVTVYFCIHTAVDMIQIVAFRGGKRVRALTYISDEGWCTDSGRKLSFENKEALKAWKQERPLASPDGYDVVYSFLGSEGNGPSRPPKTELPAWMLSELHAESRRQDRALGWLLSQAIRASRAQLADLGAKALEKLVDESDATHSDDELQRFEFVLHNQGLAELAPPEAEAKGAELGVFLQAAWVSAHEVVKAFPGIDDILE